MKLGNGILCAGLMMAALSFAQDAFSPARTYTVGEKDVYGASLKASSVISMSMTYKISYEVKKVYDNGDADIEVKAYDRSVDVGGQATKQADSPVTVTRYDKYGVPAKAAGPPSAQQPAFMNFLVYRGSATFTVGQSVKIDEDLADKAKTHVKGTSKLESIDDGIAKMVTSVDIKSEKSRKPMHLDSIAYLDVKTSKLNRAESRLTNIDSEQMPGIDSLTVVLEREKH